jgi:hypothetical protein
LRTRESVLRRRMPADVHAVGTLDHVHARVEPGGADTVLAEAGRAGGVVITAHGPAVGYRRSSRGGGPGRRRSCLVWDVGGRVVKAQPESTRAL